MNHSSPTTVVIPAFNEESTIGAVVASVRQLGLDVLVVDDGSTDSTRRQASIAGARVVSHPDNRGYDAALATGLTSAAADAEVVVTFDADSQHDPRAIDSLVAPIASGAADACVGIRSALPRWAERLFAHHGRAHHGIADPLCGMKALRAELVLHHADALTTRSIGSGLVLACARNGATVASVPVPVREREGRSRFGAGIRAEWRILAALARCLILDHATRHPAPPTDSESVPPPLINAHGRTA